jgi:hypothetical protein
MATRALVLAMCAYICALCKDAISEPVNDSNWADTFAKGLHPLRHSQYQI